MLVATIPLFADAHISSLGYLGEALILIHTLQRVDPYLMEFFRGKCNFIQFSVVRRKEEGGVVNYLFSTPSPKQYIRQH